MPFIEQWRRDIIDKHGLEGLEVVEPGDRCYEFYRQFVEQWRREPKWKTVHKLVKQYGLTEPIVSDDNLIAAHLAWQVFFQLYVMPYEIKKRRFNGDI